MSQSLKSKYEQIYESSKQSINCKHTDTVSFTAYMTAISGYETFIHFLQSWLKCELHF